MFSISLYAVALCASASASFALPRPVPAQVAREVHGSVEPLAHQAPGAQVLILGGGVAGVITARTLAQQGITDFIIVEARDELGGRMRSAAFGAPNRRLTVELGANWIQGTQEGNSPANPIFELALKHNLNAVEK